MTFEVVIHPMMRPRPGEPEHARTERTRGLGLKVWTGADRAEAERVAKEMVQDRLVIAVVRSADGQELLVLTLQSPPPIVAVRSLRDGPGVALEPVVVPSAGRAAADPLEINKACRAAAAGQAAYPVGVLATGEKLQITFARTVKGKLYARARATGRWIPIDRAEI